MKKEEAVLALKARVSLDRLKLERRRALAWGKGTDTLPRKRGPYGAFLYQDGRVTYTVSKGAGGGWKVWATGPYGAKWVFVHLMDVYL